VRGGSQGRPAALPSSGYRPAPRQGGADGLIVRYVPENPQEEPREFIAVRKLSQHSTARHVRLAVLVGHGGADGTVAADGSASGREPPRRGPRGFCR
jgi:hypothetical protein